MTLWESTSLPLIHPLNRTGVESIRKAIKHLIKDAARWKPDGYEERIDLCRDYYRDNQEPQLLKKLKEQFANSWKELPIYPTPLFKRMCQMLATIYQQRPQREMVGDDGKRNEDATNVMTQLYHDGSIDDVLSSAEEIAAAASLCLLRVGWDELNEVVSLVPYWPDKVWVMLHEDAPTQLRQCAALIAEISSPAGVNADDKHKRYEVWSLEADLTWTHSVVYGATGEWRDVEKGHTVLPWVAMPFDRPMGTLFEMPSKDDIEVNQAHSVLLGDLLYTIRMQAFGQYWASGDTSSLSDDVLVGPGHLVKLGDGGQLGAINANPSIDPVLNVVDKLTSQHLNLRSADPSAASAEPSYESGVALKVKQIPAMQRRAKRRPAFEWMEERELWPVIQYVAKHPELDKTRGYKMKWAPGETEMPLDDEAQMRVSQARVAANMSTFPKEMMHLGLAVDLNDAERQYKENLKYNEANPVTVGIPFMRSENKAKLFGKDGAESSPEEQHKEAPRSEEPREPEAQ